MTTTLRDDPRLTAYALDELSADERVTLERQLAGDPEAGAEIERIRAVTRQLDGALASEFSAVLPPALTAAQHAAIRIAATPRRLNWGLLVPTLGAAVAAGLLVMVSVAVNGHGQAPEAAPLVAKVTKPVVGDHYARSAPVLTQPPASAPVSAVSPNVAPTIELPDISRLEVELEESDKQVAAVATRDVDLPKGREEAVATAETGSTGAFMAIGAGGGMARRGEASRRSDGAAYDALGDRASSASPGVVDHLQAGARFDEKAAAETDSGRKKELQQLAKSEFAQAQAAFARNPNAADEQALLADAKLRYGSVQQRRFSAAAPAAKPAAPGTTPLPSSPGFSSVDEPPALPVTSTPGNETYTRRADNPFQAAYQIPLSTFSLDVDTASYSNVRRFLDAGRLPPRDAVRCEELINYFPYRYPAPTDGTPFAIHAEIAPCPWDPRHRLAKIALKGKEMTASERPACNLVFLIDVSGSMQPEKRLPLIKAGLGMLVESLNDRDRVAIVTYAGQSGIALPSTPGSSKREIVRAIDRLSAEGGTNGAAGITLAYQVARQGFAADGVNRVILCTDGDFNVGVTNRDELTAMVRRESRGRIFLSVMGVGCDNLQDATMEQLADRGNGHYAYLDSIAEARKVFVEQMSGTLVPIAKDVKVQVEFNPARIAGYRLIGYEKRALAARDFNNDNVDAGEVGAGHAVTALYEIVPVGADVESEGLRYQPEPAVAVDAAVAGEWMTVKLRYKAPEGGSSKLITGPVTDAMVRTTISPDLRLAAAAAAFAQILRGNAMPGMGWANLREQAAIIVREGAGSAVGDYAREFAQLIERAAHLAGNGER